MRHISDYLNKWKKQIDKDNSVEKKRRLFVRSPDTFGERLSENEILNIFQPYEGEINMYYGRIGNGKTAGATADILHLLTKGQIVYANWHINFEGYDERKSIVALLWKTIFFRSNFNRFPKYNLHYFNSDDINMSFLAGLTDCHVFIDEGQWIFDSYKGTNFDPESRRLILHTRHFNRSLNIVSQRTQAVHVSARAQINRFYKFVKILTFPFIVIKRYEYQDMAQNDVDETVDPISVRSYWLSKRIRNAYNSKYLRGGIPISTDMHYDVYRLTFKDKLRALKRAFSVWGDGFAEPQTEND
jgi:Cdc6-like AAA superfamily ATPase